MRRLLRRLFGTRHAQGGIIPKGKQPGTPLNLHATGLPLILAPEGYRLAREKEEQTMTTNDYMKIRYGSNRNRHWWGIAHRQWLVNSGRYIKTSERDQDCIDRARNFLRKMVGEAGAELVTMTVVHPEDPMNPTAAELGIKPGGIL